MTKYVLSSGLSVISEIPTLTGQKLSYSITNVMEHAIQFDTIGEAIKAASKVNEILGQALYRAVPIDIN